MPASLKTLYRLTPCYYERLGAKDAGILTRFSDSIMENLANKM